MGSRKPRELTVSEQEALSIIAKLKAGKSSGVMAEARRLGCYHATLRKAMRAAVGSKEYAELALADKSRHRKRSPRAKIPPRRQSKPVPQPPKPKRIHTTRSSPGSVVLQPLGVEVVQGKAVELRLSETRVLLCQRLGNSVRITAARRTTRTFSDALELGGTVIVPHNTVSDVCDALREAAG